MEHITPAKNYLKLSALLLCLALAVCTALRPSAVFSYYGFSYFGNFRDTLLPFTLGMIAAAYYLRRAATSIAGDAAHLFRRVRTGLQAMSLSMLGLVVTPSLSPYLPIQRMHVLFGMVVLVNAASLSLFCMVRERGEWTDRLLILCQLMAVVIIGLSLDFLGVLKLMLPAQIASAVIFIVMVVRFIGYRATPLTTRYD